MVTTTTGLPGFSAVFRVSSSPQTMVAALAYLHGVVVDQASGALDDTKVSLEVAPAGVAVSLGVVGGAVEEDPGACVVLHDVVMHNRTAGAEDGRKEDETITTRTRIFRHKAEQVCGRNSYLVRCVERFELD